MRHGAVGNLANTLGGCGRVFGPWERPGVSATLAGWPT
jgi:hypothetical protein